MSEPVVAAPLKKMILGDKPWFKSLTIWGVIVFVTAEAFMGQVCDAGVLSAGVCSSIGGVMKTVGGVMGMLGLRRAAVSPNVS